MNKRRIIDYWVDEPNNPNWNYRLDNLVMCLGKKCPNQAALPCKALTRSTANRMVPVDLQTKEPIVEKLWKG